MTAPQAGSLRAKVMQDGDIDGCMLMGRLPTKAEAEVIRSRLSILKKREVGELELERLRNLQRAAGRRVGGSRLSTKSPSGPPETASDDLPGPLRDGSLILSDLRQPTIRVICGPCGRRGSYTVAKLMERHGDAKLTDLLVGIAQCPKARSVSIHYRCRATFE